MINWQNYSKNFIGGLIAGGGFIFVVGGYFFVQAIAPGATENPSFAPDGLPGHNVEFPLAVKNLDCIDVLGTWEQPLSEVTCPGDHPMALSGGCNLTCSYAYGNTLVGNKQTCIAFQFPNSWCVNSGQRSTQAYLKCCALVY